MSISMIVFPGDGDMSTLYREQTVLLSLSLSDCVEMGTAKNMEQKEHLLGKIHKLHINTLLGVWL